MKRTLSVVAVVAVLSPLAAGAVQADPVQADTVQADTAKKAPPLAVTGYAMGGTGSTVIAASAKGLRTVTVDGVSISGDGASVESPYPSLASVGRIAHAHGLRTELLVSNYSNELGDFDADAAHRLLSSAVNINHLATTMAGFVKAGRYDGANIDLEQVAKRDATGLVNLARAL
jgi:spore germination protein